MAENGAQVKEGLEVVGHLVRQLSRQFQGAIDQEDLRSAGNEGLVLAIRDFDATRGVPFRSWANLRAKGAMLDAVRARGGLPRSVYRRLKAIEASLAVSEGRQEEDAAKPIVSPADADKRLSDHLQATASAMAISMLGETALGERIDDKPSPEEALAREQLNVRVRDCLARLPENERKLVERYYFEEWTLEKAGAEQGLSKSWSSRLLAKATESIARGLRASS
jgi:RNA polymerase sigma factor FliA